MSAQLVFIYSQGVRVAVHGEPAAIYDQLLYGAELVGDFIPLPHQLPDRRLLRRARRRSHSADVQAGRTRRVLRVGPGFVISYQQRAEQDEPAVPVLKPLGGPRGVAPPRPTDDLSARVPAALQARAELHARQGQAR